jgi:glycosyltransferase involved in cell wall biosynthesis
MKHVLYLPSWFPTRRDPFAGDFIKRHAEAASLYNRITIFFTTVDDKIKEPEITEEKINENLSVYIFYYPAKKGILSPLLNGVKRFAALKKMYSRFFGHSAPDIVHVHVVYPAGLFALYLKKRKGLGFIISEHNTIYLPNHDDQYIPGIFEKRMTPVIYKHAEKVHSVSKALANSLINLKLATDPIVIPNVVDTLIFNYKPKQKEKFFHFVHVSSLIHQKNPEGMLHALSLVRNQRKEFVLKIIGPPKQELVKLVKKLSLEKNVFFLGEIAYEVVAKEISNSDLMIHFTRFETFGCVIAESLCSGVPVIVSELDVTRELITDKVNGLFITEGNVKDLADKILYFMAYGIEMDSQKIAENSQEKFNYKSVGKMFDDLYKSLNL